MNLLICLSLLFLIVNHVKFVVTLDIDSLFKELTDSLLKDDEFHAIIKREANAEGQPDATTEGYIPPINAELSKYCVLSLNSLIESGLF